MTRHKLSIPALLLLVLIGFFWKLTLTSQFTWLELPDTAFQVVPWQQVQAEAFHKGKLPLWDPYLWGGQSLIGQMQAGTAYPLNWILYALPLRDGHIRLGYLHWYLVFLHWLAAIFAYMLCRELGRSRIASFLGGLAFTLVGVIGTIEWPQKLNGIIWIPLVLLYFLRGMGGRAPALNIALSGVFLGTSWLSGHHQIPLYTTLLMGAMWLFDLYQNRHLPGWLHRVKLLVVWSLFLAFTAALQVLPAWVYGHQSVRWVGLPEPIEWNQKVPFNIHQQYSLGLSTLFGLLIPTVNHEAQPYTGPVILSLAALAIGMCWRQFHVRMFAVITIGSIFFALGSQDVLYGIIYAAVPSAEKARAPALAILFANFGAAILAAYGFDALRTSQGAAAQSVIWIRSVSRVTAAIGGFVLAMCLGVMMTKQLRFDYDDRIVGVGMLCLLVAVLYLTYSRGNVNSAALSSCCLLLLLIDLGNSTGYYYIHERDKDHAVYLRHLSGNQDILGFLRGQPGHFRFELDREEISANWGDWYGMETYNGYVASLPALEVKLGLGGYRPRMLYGTRYWVSRKPQDPDQIVVFSGKSGLKVYESPGVLPRAWAVHQALSASSPEQAGAQFYDAQFDLRKTVSIVGQLPHLDSCAGSDSVKLLDSGFDTVMLDASLECGGLVVLSDNYDLDWSATVDGKPARIWPVDTVIRGVEVPAGAHRIEMRYRPLSVYVGAVMLLISVFSLAFLFWRERKRTPALPMVLPS